MAHCIIKKKKEFRDMTVRESGERRIGVGVGVHGGPLSKPVPLSQGHGFGGFAVLMVDRSRSGAYSSVQRALHLWYQQDFEFRKDSLFIGGEGGMNQQIKSK